MGDVDGSETSAEAQVSECTPQSRSSEGEGSMEKRLKRSKSDVLSKFSVVEYVPSLLTVVAKCLRWC